MHCWSARRGGSGRRGWCRAPTAGWRGRSRRRRACSGVAVGVDRLYALLLGLPAIGPLMACAELF